MDKNNFILLYRKIQNNPLWLEGKFDKRSAWLDLVLLANWKDTPFAKRGVCKTTQVWLAQRWQWHRESVASFLTDMKTSNQIDIKTDTRYTYITIRNYNVYQPNQQPDQQQTVIKTSNKTSTTKEGEEGNKEKKVITPYNPPIEEIEEIAKQYGVTIAFVNFQMETLKNYIASSGKIYKDPKAALRNFVLRDMKKTLERSKPNERYGYTDLSQLK